MKYRYKPANRFRNVPCPYWDGRVGTKQITNFCDNCKEKIGLNSVSYGCNFYEVKLYRVNSGEIFCNKCIEEYEISQIDFSLGFESNQ